MSIRNLFSVPSKTRSQRLASGKATRRRALRKRLLGHETLEDRRLLASFANAGLITINDDTVATPYPSVIPVALPAGVSANVLDVNATLVDVSHTFIADLNVLLTAPGGGNVELLRSAGGSNDAVNDTWTFDDGAPAMTDAGNPGSGTFSPTQSALVAAYPAPAPAGPYGTTMASLAGGSPAGNWSLFVLDDLLLDVGAIAGGWSLDLQLGGPLVIDAGAAANDAAADTFEARRVGANLQIEVNNTLVFDEPYAGVASLTVNGSGDDDTLIVDHSGGILDLPISFGGGGQVSGDTLIVNDGNFNTIASNYLNANDGNLDFDGSVISYTGLEPVLLNVGSVNDIIFNLPAGPNADVLLADDGPGNFPLDLVNDANTSAIDASTFEFTQFTNPANSLSVNLGDNGDTLDVSTLDAAYAASLIINGGTAATDNVQLNAVDLVNTPGRGLWVTETETLGITGGVISGNTAGIGGGILIDNSTSGTTTTTTIDGAIISNNTATGGLAPLEGGGGITNRGGELVINAGTEITDNDATGLGGSGGGILNLGGTVSITGALIADNTAQRAGGGIEDNAGLGTTITDTTIRGNTALGNPGRGGGIHITGAGSVSLDGSTVSDNSAQEGGGLWNSAVGTFTLTNSTVSGNTATTSDGGGIFNTDGGIVDLDSVTVTLNSGSGTGDGIFGGTGGVTIENTIVAQNPGGGVEANLSGTINSQDFNLIGDPDNGTLVGVTVNTIFDADALLLPLTNTGGATETHQPAAGSPVVGFGSTTLTVDQRNIARPQGSQDDIGAVEADLDGFVISADDLAAGQAGDGNDDHFLIINDAGGITGNVEVYVNGVLVFSEPKATTGLIVIRGSADDDTLEVDNSNGLVGAHIVFDADGASGAPAFPVAGGFDRLILRGSTPTDSVYNPGETADAGAVFQTNNQIVQRVEFFGLEPLQIVGTGGGDTLTVAAAPLGIGFPQALNADNSIHYSEGPSSNNPLDPVFAGAVTGLVTVDGFESLEFANFGTLTINAGAGQDAIHLNNPVTPTDLTDIIVDGGDPGDGDALTVSGTAAQDSTTITPTAADSGTVAIVGLPNVAFSGVDRLSYEGQGGDDLVTISTPAGDDTIVHTPGEAVDEGAVRVNSLVRVHYQNLGAAATLTVADTGGNDTLVVNGTASDDAFDVVATSGAVTLVTPSTTYLALNQTQVENLSLDGLDGNDDFVINGPQPYSNVNIFGGGPGGSDVLTVNGAAATDETFTVTPAFDRGDGTVSVNALLVPYIGIEHVLLDANDADNDDLIINDDVVDNQWTVNAGPIVGDRVQINGRESIDYSDFNDVTLNNSFGTDHFDIHPTNLIGFDGDFTVNGDPAAGAEPVDDVLNIFGTPGDDVVTSTATAVTTNGITITVGNLNFAELRILTLGGADVIGHDGLGGNPAPMALALAGVRKVIDAGNEDDIVNLSNMMDAIIFGGLGNDVLIGSPLDDTIFGGPGNDILIGGAGSDFQYGEEGNDIFGNPTVDADGVADDPGQDFNFGGPGFDNFIWEPGDGPDVNSGGDDGGDIFRFFGNAAANTFTLRAGGTPTHFNALIGALVIDNHGIEDVRVDGLGGADTFIVNDLFETEVVSINLLLGAADAAIDAVTVNGRTTADTLQVTTGGAGNVGIEGLTYDVNLNQAELANDTLTINGNEGDDSIHVETGVQTVLTSTLNGNLGDDLLSGWFNTANGNEGDDVIRGAGNDQTINGGAGEDTMVGGLGLDTFDGGSGFDTILVEGFSSDDRIDLRQDNPTTLRHEVGNAGNGFDGVLGGAGTETDTLVINTVEQVRILAGEGDDTIRVAHDDSLVAAAVAADMLRISVDGGDPGASDRLTVIDDGAGDTNVQRLGQTDGDGSFTTYAFSGGNPANPIISLPPVIYTDVEYASLNPIGPVSGGTGADGNGRLFVFKYDPFEQNQSLPTATFLGADSAINLDPNIDPGVDAVFGTPGDEDWYRVVAEKTGTLDFQVYFRQQGALANGRAGLPNAGNLDIAVFDADGLVNGVPLAIAGNGAFGANDADNDERVRIPAVAGQTYYLRVVGADLPAGNNVNASPAINAYNVSVVNTEPATPFDLELADNLTILTGAQENPAVPTAANGTANFQYNAAANTFNLDLFVAGLELSDTTSQPELTMAHIHRGVVGVNGPVIVTLSAGIGGWVQEPSGIRLKLTNAPFSGVAADITALLAGDTYINVHSTANPTGEVRGQILIQNVLGVSDSGRSQFDNVTQDNTPTILLRLDDALLLNDLPGNAAGVLGATPPDQLIPIPHNPSTAASPVGLAAGYRVAIYDETDTHNPVLLGFAQPIANLNGVYSFTFTTPLAEGSHFISSRVQMIDPADNDASNVSLTPATGFGPRGESLEIIVDTPAPPVSFGDAAVLGDGLHPDSDSGDPAVPATLVDGITNDLTPTFFGRAEANAIVRLYVDVDGTGTITAPDVLIGQTVAVPTDGTNQSPNGEWQITSTVSMNDPNRLGGLGVDGARTILVQAEDLAGNLSADDLALQLNIFIDTRGPQVTDVFITGRQDFDLFTLKPETPEPTPRVDSLTINVQDLPNRIAAFLYPAISNLPVAPNVLPLGLISLVGDHSGIIPMTSVTFTSDGNLNLPGVQPLAPGNPATGFITLTFDEPLPDDRFTLTLSDSIIDPAGNALDGESNASEPVGTPQFPSGDGIAGGDFIARFTVDSRPEVATWSQELVYVDINGNFVWDPQGEDNDATNRDFIYHFGATTDAYFAGNFAANFLPGGDGILGTADDVAVNPNNVMSSGFDKMGTFGRFNGQYQFFLDTNDDGVGDTVGPMFFQVNVIPVAGNFFNSAADVAAIAAGQRPRDEIGGFDGQFWYLDTNGNNQIDANERFATSLRGIPVVGDFNGDGFDDLATFNNETGVFQFDLDRNGTVDDTLTYFFSGFGEKPVAGDVNLDGVDDIVLWLPNRDGQLPKEAGEFHYLVSDNPAAALPSAVFNAYSPAPLGNDLIAQFGDEFALPLLGNFDPPIGDIEPLDTTGWFTNTSNSLDVDADGLITPFDALLVINGLNRGVTSAAPSQAIRALQSFGGHFLDTDGDSSLTPFDALQVINELNRLARAAGHGEASPQSAASYAAAVDSVFADDDDDDAELWNWAETDTL